MAIHFELNVARFVEKMRSKVSKVCLCFKNVVSVDKLITKT